MPGRIVLNVTPDRLDLRDRPYLPAVAVAPPPALDPARRPEAMNQGESSACTGFALAAVIDHLLARSGRAKDAGASPWMLYSMARRYDEWPGENYEGSSARGAMKGWVAHGVCKRETWGSLQERTLTEELSQESSLTPGGAYYRVTHRNIRDLHAALAESGILYMTLMVHGGWDRPGPSTRKLHFAQAGKQRSLDVPIIRRRGRAEDGHAVAIVG